MEFLFDGKCILYSLLLLAMVFRTSLCTEFYLDRGRKNADEMPEPSMGRALKTSSPGVWWNR